MAEASIPVDLFNPGQVFACLGFLEAAEVLLGDAEGGFDWERAADVRFRLSASDANNPFEVVLGFLAQTRPERWGPVGYSDADEDADTIEDDETSGDVDVTNGSAPLNLSETFPARKGDRLSLPVRLVNADGMAIELGHWADGSGREPFKLYSGNRSADGIAKAMLVGTRRKPKSNQTVGDLKTKGVTQLWQEQRGPLIEYPFDVLTPMGGSFNFDPRGAWTAIDAGYSPNDQKHLVSASPVVEILAAWGLENARPDEFATRRVRYSVWGLKLPPELARVALFGGIEVLPRKTFRFELALSGKNKIVNFAQQESES